MTSPVRECGASSIDAAALRRARHHTGMAAERRISSVAARSVAHDARAVDIAPCASRHGMV